MRRCKLALVVVVGIVAVLHGLTLQAGAGGVQPGTLTNCQTAHPSGAPISIVSIKKDFIPGTTITVNEITVLAEFRGATFGPFTVTNESVFNVLNPIDAGCKIFNDLGLSSQILSAIGLPGTTLSFTACSFLGASSPECHAPPGTINTPPGWPSNQITGYAQP